MQQAWLRGHQIQQGPTAMSTAADDKPAQEHFDDFYEEVCVSVSGSLVQRSRSIVSLSPFVVVWRAYMVWRANACSSGFVTRLAESTDPSQCKRGAGI